MSPPLARSLGPTQGSSTSVSTVADDQEEDDICPVCESECTCNSQPSSSAFRHPPDDRALRAARPDPIHPPFQAGPLKIKLTLPASLQSKAPPTSSSKPPAPRTNTKKSKRLDESMSTAECGVQNSNSGAIGSPFSAPGQPLIHGGANQSHLNMVRSVPKKRGRPPKNAHDPLPKITGNELSKGHPIVGSSRPQNRRKIIAPRKGTKPPAKTSKASEAQKSKRNRAQSSSTSDLTETVDDDSDSQSLQFPTFLSALSSSSHSSSEADSEFDDDQFIDPHPRESARLRRELMAEMDQDNPRKWLHRNNWIIHPRKSSVGPDGNSVSATSDDSGVETDQEDDEDADAEEDDEEEDETDPGMVRKFNYAGVPTAWSEDEDTFDADLFFANLSSSSDGESDEHMIVEEDDASSESMNVLSLTEAAAAGFLSPFEELQRLGVDTIPFEMTQSWDGQYTFSGGLESEGILDLTFEASAAQFTEATHGARDSDDNGTAMATSEEETVPVVLEEEEVGYVCDESEGDTTEDEYVEVDGIPTPRIKFLPSMGAINPIATLSPTHLQTRFTFSPLNAPLESPKPADILAGKIFPERMHTRDRSASIAESTMSSFTCSSTSKPPNLGSFSLDPEPSTQAVIFTSSTKDFPSPFPASKRLRRPQHRRTESLQSDTNPFLLPYPTTPSTLQFQSFSITEMDIPSSPIPATPIELDEVVDASLLSMETSESVLGEPIKLTSEPESHSQNKWDIIPIDTFRRTRATTGGVDEHPFWPPPRSATADGFSYGSASGSMMRGSPLNAALWNNQTSRPNRRRRPNYAISPVLLPTRDGDRTPPDDHALHQNHHLHHGHSHNQIPNSKSRKEQQRKEKKVIRKMIGAGPHHRRGHFPNNKSRSNSSIQRPRNFTPSRVPPLTI